MCDCERCEHYRETKPNAGKLDQTWVGNCRTNEGPDSTLEDWLCEAGNYAGVWIDAGSVWAWQDHETIGNWLSQDRLDELVRRIDH